MAGAASVTCATSVSARASSQARIAAPPSTLPTGSSVTISTLRNTRGSLAKGAALASGPLLGDGYYANTRQDIVDALPRPVGSALDVGCGAGAVGPGLRAAGATRLTGVEVVPEQAELARAHYDVVLAEPVEQALEKLEGPFDTILCLDVLEHLVDPERVMAALRDLAAPGARLQVSLPNARHVSLMRDLIFRGTFGYTQWGHRDRTHLRWFTKRDIVDAMTEAGWAVQRVSHPALNRSRRLDALTRGRSTEFLVGQWYVLASNAGAAGAAAPLSSSAATAPG